MARFTKVAVPLLLITSISPALADEGASGLYVPGNFGFGAGVTPDPGLYLSTGIAYYDGDIKIYIEGGKIVLDVDKREGGVSRRKAARQSCRLGRDLAG